MATTSEDKKIKYYIINTEEQQEGPYELEQLADAGVTPETYVWCKGMEDWQQAAEVPEICRHWRNRLYDIMHPSSPAAASLPAIPTETGGEGFRLGFSYRAGTPLPKPHEIHPDTSRPPARTLFLSVLASVLCFPLTGLMAIYYSYMARKKWQGGEKELAHEMSRMAKMWLGITFFLGLILMGMMFFRN